MSIQPTTTELSVEDAVAKLGQSKQDLWKEKVTDVVWYSKIVGIISYLLNVNAVDQYNIKLAEVVNQVSRTMLTESSHLNLGNAVRNNIILNAEQLDPVGTQQAIAEQALSNFYDAFKNRCSKLGVSENSKEFGVFAQAAKKMLTDAQAPADHKHGINVKYKMPAYINKFEVEMYKDMVKAFASQAAKDINMEKYAERVDSIGKLFGKTAQEVETSIREGVLNVEGNAKAFAALITEFQKTDVNSLREVYKLATSKDLETKKSADEKRIAELNGKTPGADDSEIHQNWVQYDNLNKEFLGLVGVFNVTSTNRIAEDANKDAVLEIQDKYKGQPEQIKAILAKMDEMNVALTKLNDSIALRDKLHAENIITNLKLLPAAMTEAANNYADWNIAFYTELQQAVTAENAANRFKEMDKTLRQAKLRK